MNFHQVFTFVAKQSGAVNWVPKQELGNQMNLCFAIRSQSFTTFRMTKIAIW